MQILDYKYLDIVRENHDLEPFDDSATFGEDMEKRWDHFFKNHIVKDEQGNDAILYKDKYGNYRLSPANFH